MRLQWTDTIKEAFNEGKQEIVRAIEDGMEIDPSLETCIRTNWSKQGMGYYRCQKACQCPEVSLTCCSGSWQICLARSRFNSDAEAQYAPIEGEALAVAWALERSKFFTQGCDWLTVATDHKPLVSLLGQKSLDQVPNARLFRIKQRISMWKFRMIHFADVTSRNPVSPEDDRHFVAVNLALIAVTIEVAADAAKEDAPYWALHHVLSLGTAPVAKDCKEYFQYRDQMYPRDGVLLFSDRLVILEPLRNKDLNVLHSAHQVHNASQSCRDGFSGRGTRSTWKRGATDAAHATAASQAQVPTIQSAPPSTPFESVAAVFFHLAPQIKEHFNLQLR